MTTLDTQKITFTDGGLCAASDGRQGLPTIAHRKPTSKELAHRYTYHAPKGDQVERYARIRHAILEAANLCVELTPCSPEQTRALDALDEAGFLFNAAIARNE